MNHDARQAAIWNLLRFVLYDHYPPRLFVFLPLYRLLRRRLRFPMAISNFLVWSVSAVLHSGALLLLGHPVAAAVFFLVFFVLGVVSTAVVRASKRTSAQAR